MSKDKETTDMVTTNEVSEAVVNHKNVRGKSIIIQNLGGGNFFHQNT